jgi:hypothetical protein
MPRGDELGYTSLVSFDGEKFENFEIPVEPSITRKFTDLVKIDKKLYSLPFGETSGLNDVVEFDTENNTVKLYKLNVPDFAKKYNSMVVVNEYIIGMPYGDEQCDNSNWGVVFNTLTKESISFDIGIGHGGKYRYRCGIKFNDNAVFFPSGTPQCPIYIIDTRGIIQRVLTFSELMFGRPIIYKEKIHVLAYNIHTERQFMYIFDQYFDIEVKEL